MSTDTLIVIAAQNEADRIRATLAALAAAFPGAPVWVADDGSTDATRELARAAGATVVCCENGAAGAARRAGAIGKGQAMTAGAWAALQSMDSFDANARARIRTRIHADSEDSFSEPFSELPGAPPAAEPTAAETTVVESPVDGSSTAEPIVVLCDGDLGESAVPLAKLVEAVRLGDADMAVAKFARRAGGGVGLAVGFARWAICRRCGLQTQAPISGQRALRARVLQDALPFAPGFGMEIGMTIDTVRAGHRVVEVELDLAHRATGRTLGGFIHRGRQLVDFMRVYWARR